MMSRTIRPTVKTALYLSLAVLAVNAARMGVGQVRAQAGASALSSGAAPVPHTVVLSEVIVGKTGRRTSGPNQTWAVRADGAFAFQIVEGGATTRQITFPDGTRIDVNDSQRTKSTVRKALDQHWLKDPAQNCVSAPHRATSATQPPPVIETVQGHRAAKITKGGTTAWYALDAGCATLKRDHEFEEGGSSHLELVSLIPGEPSTALFTTAAHYVEGPPSALNQTPTPCSPACMESRKRHFERRDDEYRQYRVP